MDKKTKGYTLLSAVDHKMQFVNLIGIINEITPVIKRNKMLGHVLVEMNDRTLNNPGFCATLNFESEVLDQFLAVAKKGLVIELLYIKVAKNDGVTRGEVWDEGEVRLYNDDASRLKWWCEEKKCSTSDKAKKAIEELKKWKIKNVKENSETLKQELKIHTEKKNVQNESLNLECSTNSNVSRNKSIVASDTSISSEASLKDGNNKKKTDSVNRENTKMADTSVKHSPKGNNTKNSILDKPTQIIDVNHKIQDGKTRKSDSVGCDISKKRKLTNSPGSLRSVKEDSFEHDKSVRHTTNFKHSEKSCNHKITVQCHNAMKDEIKIVKRDFDKEKSDKTANKRSAIIICESRSSDSSLNLEKETRLHKHDTSVSDSNSSKSSHFKNKPAKEKLAGKMSKSKEHFSNSSSHLLSLSSSVISIDSDVSKSDVQVISGAVKKNTDEKSQKELRKKSERNNDCKGIRKKSAIIKEINDKIIESSRFKLTRSKSSTNISQLKYLKNKVRPARHSLPSRNRVLNSNTLNLNKELRNTKSIRNKSVKVGNSQEKSLSFLRNKFASPINNDVKASLQSKKPANVHKTESEESKLNDSSQIKNANQKPSKQDINDINILDKRSTSRINKISLTIPSRPSDQGGSGKTLKRKSMIGPKVIEASADKRDLASNLSSLTRKIHLLEVEANGDISTCDIEDIDVPEKMDLQCKVLSDFYLFEDNIQIVRVQDGTVCKSPALHIPEKGSWKEIVTAVLKAPTIMKKSPFIDIIIFDFPLMDSPVVSGEMYEFKNVMAIKLNLKNDPRMEKKSKGELFFCAKGPDIYTKKLRPKMRQEIEKRLSKENHKKMLAEFLGEKVINVGESDRQSEIILSSSKTPELCHVDPLQFKHIDNGPSPTNKKRKSAVVDRQSNDKQQGPAEKRRKIEYEEKTCKETEKESPRNKDAQTILKINPKPLSDETMLGETECLIIRELSEIMHEESLLGFPQTSTEDVHLKNTGSEVTFSQFCAGAEGKSVNFRTSTEVETMSEDIVPLNQKELSPTPDSSKMEPLVYTPSNCSDSFSPRKHIESTRPKDIKECSESILQHYTIKAISDDQSNCSKLKNSENEEKDEEKISTNLPTNNDALSVEVLSSNSSVIEIKVINNEDCSNVSENAYNETQHKPSETSKLSEDPNLEHKSLKSTVLSAHNSSKICKNNLQNKSLDHNLEKELEGSGFDKGEDMSIISSTIVSDFSFKNNIQSVTSKKPLYVIPNKSNQSKIILQKIEMEISNTLYPSSFDNCKRISDSCFFQSDRDQYPSMEEINAIFNEENQLFKYFSYSIDRNLPFLTFDVIRKLENNNYISVTVTIEKISPPVITDSWKDDCIKARCPCCNKLYSAYNALNNRCSENATSLSALYVRGLIVCPESQCCNQVLESPEFHFSVDAKLKDGSLVTALVAGTHAEQLFGCKAQEAARDETALRRVKEILQKISTKIDTKQFVKIDFMRENICNPNSGQLYIKNISF